jgi:hypothetical protein
MNNNVMKYPPKSNNSDCRNCLDTQQSISAIVFRLNNSLICWRSKKQKFVATSMCEAEYMVLAIAMNQWIWMTNALEELNMLVTNAAM